MSRPATAFTGDFYFTTAARGDFWFAAGDFAGHGLGAAVFAAMIQEELEALVSSSDLGPEEVVVALDRMLRRETPGNRFASLVVGRAGPDGAVDLVNAGHCTPIMASAGGELSLLDASGPIVGMLPSPRWRRQTVELAPGDRLILFTDGLVEAEDEGGEPFGLERLLSVLRVTPAEAPLETILSAADRHSGGDQADDVTLFVVSRDY